MCSCFLYKPASNHGKKRIHSWEVRGLGGAIRFKDNHLKMRDGESADKASPPKHIQRRSGLIKKVIVIICFYTNSGRSLTLFRTEKWYSRYGDIGQTHQIFNDFKAVPGKKAGLLPLNSWQKQLYLSHGYGFSCGEATEVYG